MNWAGSINENPISTCTGTANGGTNTYSISMRKVGTGTLVLSNANNFGGVGIGVLGDTTTVGNWVYGFFMPTAGTVDLANQYAVQSVIMSLGNGGTLVFDQSVANHTFQIGGLSGQGLLSLQDTAGTPINLVVANGTFTEYGGVLQGPGSFTEAGGTGGVTILYSPNTYAGSTTVTSGTLQLADPHAVPATSTLYMSGGNVVFDRFVSGPSGVPAFSFGGLSDVIGSPAGGTISLQNNAAAPVAITLTVGGNNQSTTYGGYLTGSGAITKTGTGTLTLTGPNNYTGMTILSGGTLELALAAQSPILSGGGIDIQGCHTVFNYPDQAPAILSDLQYSFNDGAWNRGQFQSTTAGLHVGLGWKDDAGAQQVTVQPAYYGDATLDGSVNASDLSIELANYGDPGNWSQGDFNYDGQVNASDLAVVLANYGETGGPTVIVAGGGAAAGVSPVPEPSTIAMLASILGIAGLWLVRRRRGAAALLDNSFSLYHRRHSMRKLVLVLSVCLVLGGALVANAETMQTAYVQTGNVTIGYERNVAALTYQSVTYDEIRFYLTGFTGVETGDQGVTLMENSTNGGATATPGWTDAGGTFWLCSAAGSSTWVLRTANTFFNGYDYAGVGGTATQTPGDNYLQPYSVANLGFFANFPGIYRTGSGTAYSQFGGSWNQGGFHTSDIIPYPTDEDPSTNGSGLSSNLIADLFVTASTQNVEFQGGFGYDTTGHYTDVVFAMTTPEPSTFALLASGLIGLLCYAWRKRK